ncbi:MAG: DUF6249 domain-containing protein [Bdellovibrionales bacterium]
MNSILKKLSFLLSVGALSILTVTASAQGEAKVEAKKEKPIFSLDNGKVQITKSGIVVRDGEETHAKVSMGPDEDIVVPIALFIMLAVVILGAKYFSSKNEQRRLDVLQKMVEKGQPIPEGVITQILNTGKQESEDSRATYKRTRNAYGFSIAGVALLGYAVITGSFHATDVLVPGLVFLCLGLGGLAGLYLQKSEEKA